MGEMVGIIAVALGCLVAGALLRGIPAKRLVQMDSQTGHYVYKQTLAQTGDVDRAIAAAGFFYRLFGLLIWGFGLVWALLGAAHLLFG